MGFIALHVSANSSALYEAPDIKRLLIEYPWLLVLDGLDEVPASANRIDLIRALDTFWIDVSSCGADVFVLATTRPQGYNDELAGAYVSGELAPLRDEQVQAYASRLCAARHGADTERYRKTLALLSQAAAEPTTAKLMTTPLQISIMQILVEQTGPPPQQRWQLFNRYFQTIFDRERARPIGMELLATHADDVVMLHRQVGLVLQVAAEGAAGTDARLSREALRTIAVDSLCEKGFDSEEALHVAVSMVACAENRLVFLVGHGDDELGFELRSLQEFLAAEAIMDGSDNAIRARIAAIADHPFWRNVVLFAIGKCASERPHLAEYAVSVVDDLNAGEGDDDPLFLTRAGSKLAIDVLEEGSLSGYPVFARRLTQAAARSVEVAESDSGPSSLRRVALARSASDRTLTVLVDELVTRISGANSGNRVAWECLTALLPTHPAAQTRLIPQLATLGPGIGRLLASGYERWSEEFKRAYGAALGQVEPAPFFLTSVRRRMASAYHPKPTARSAQLAPPLPAWISGALELGPASERFSLRGFAATGVEVAIPVMSGDQPHRRRLLSFVRWEPPRPEWVPYQLLGAYLLQPSSDLLRGLVAKLQQMADAAPVLAVSPWPVIDAYHGKSDKLVFPPDDDWARVEDDWRSAGVLPSRPWISSAHSIRSRDVVEPGLVLALVNELSKGPNRASTVAWVASRMVFEAIARGSLDGAQSPDWVVDVVENLARRPCEEWEASLRVPRLTKRLIPRLAAVSKHAVGNVVDAATVRSLRGAWIDGPSNTTARLLLYLHDDMFASEMTSVCRFIEADRTRDVELVCLVAVRGWRASATVRHADLEVISRLTMERCSDEPLAEAVGRAVEHDFSYLDLRIRLATALAVRFPHSRVSVSLERLLSYRPSPMRSAETWAAFELPERLRRCIANP